MSQTLKDVVTFRKDKLFNGAVDTEWFYADPDKSEEAARNFVFHGPRSHAVRQDDLHSSHRLVDTATFAVDLLKRSYGFGDSVFGMVIAGYGSGKSHLALTLGHLLHDRPGETTSAILASIDAADPELGSSARKHMATDKRPALVVPVNGMGRFDLATELTSRMCALLLRDDHDVTPVNDLRPRFKVMAKLIGLSAGNTALNDEILEETGKSDIDAVIQALTMQDETIYAVVHKIMAKHGFAYKAPGAESVKDLLNVVVSTYCGDGKPYRSLVILFDEFGKYMEFATVKPHIAGDGVLQDLFEGIQAHSDLVHFVGFVQYELNVYAQRLAPAQQNEFKRYGTRYESAEKTYLSTNIETLIANLIERMPGASAHVPDDGFAAQIMKELRERFPLAAGVAAWSDERLFRDVVMGRCWPLSPHAMWFVYHLAASGKFLQGRSALNLLDEAFGNLSDIQVSSVPAAGLPPAMIWTDALQAELIAAEESGLQGNVAQSYAVIEGKYAGKLTAAETAVLRAIVIAGKTNMSAASKDDAAEGIAMLAGLSAKEARTALESLQDEYNVVEWDQGSRSFDLVGDAAPRRQFLNVLRRKTAQVYDQQALGNLFSLHASDRCDCLGAYDTSFGEQNHIKTQEWQFGAVTASLQDLPTKLSFEAMKWHEVSADGAAVNKPKGRIFYVYVGQQIDIVEQKSVIRGHMADLAKEHGEKGLPFLCVLIHDETGEIGQALAELDIMDGFSEEERGRYANLMPAHRERLLKDIDSNARECIRKRHYVHLVRNLDKIRIGDVCLAIFESIYPKPLAFPCDGFGTAKGNATKTCTDFVRKLLGGSMSMHLFNTLSAADKGRCGEIFINSWKILTKDGILATPKYALLKSLFTDWDARLKQAPIPLTNLYRELVLPPYGANFVSAQLAIACFVAGRLDTLLVNTSNGKQSLQKWSEAKFSAQSLTPPSWDKDTIELAGATPDEWTALMREWESADTYFEICECRNRADRLNERLPVPHMVTARYATMCRESDTAKQKQAEYESRLSTALEKIEIGAKKESFHLLLSGASKLKKLRNDMERESDRWMREEFDRINEDYPVVRTHVAEMYPEWKTAQRPRDFSVGAVNDFLRSAEEEIIRLRLIDLNTEAEEFGILARQVKSHAEQHARISQEKLAMEQWADSVTLQIRGKTMLELGQLKQLANGHLKKSKAYAKSYSDFAPLVERLEGIARSLVAEENALKKALADILDATFDNPSDARRVIDELNRLIGKFEGDERNIRDMDDMRQVARTCIDLYARIDAFRGTKTEFGKFRDEVVGEASGSIEEAELPWDAELVIGSYADAIAARRDADFADRWERILREADGLDGMTAAEAEAFRSKANNVPEWDAEGYADRIGELNRRIDDRLERVEADWIMSRFERLNKKARAALLKRIVAIMD